MRTISAAVAVCVLGGAMAGVAQGAGATPACFGRAPTIVGTPEDDDLLGTPGRDVIHALGGIDKVRGGGGNDLICLGSGGSEPSEILESANGGSGDDRIDGGKGADAIRGNTGNDRLSGGTGYDVLSGGRGHDYVSDPAGPNGYFYGGPGNDTLIGSEQRDEFSDDLGNDVIKGNGGNDQVVLENGGVDTIDMAEGTDILWVGGDGSEPITIDLQAGLAQGAALGTDHLAGIEDVLAFCDPCDITGDDGPNVVYTNSGPVRGLGGDDKLTGPDLEGGEGNDQLFGGYLDDTASGGAGDDTYTGYDGNDSFDGGDGADTIRYVDGPVEVDLAAGTATGPGRAGEWDNVLVSIENVWGSAKGDRILGTDGDNVLLGGWPEQGRPSGDDYIDGRGGTDTLDGRNGTDTCVNGEDVRNCEA